MSSIVGVIVILLSIASVFTHHAGWGEASIGMGIGVGLLLGKDPGTGGVAAGILVFIFGLMLWGMVGCKSAQHRKSQPVVVVVNDSLQVKDVRVVKEYKVPTDSLVLKSNGQEVIEALRNSMVTIDSTPKGTLAFEKHPNARDELGVKKSKRIPIITSVTGSNQVKVFAEGGNLFTISNCDSLRVKYDSLGRTVLKYKTAIIPCDCPKVRFPWEWVVAGVLFGGLLVKLIIT